MLAAGIGAAGLSVSSASASVFGGEGLKAGVAAGTNILTGGQNLTLREIVVRILVAIMNFLALAGVIGVVVAGIYLIVSNGDEESKTKAKTIITYIVVGIVLVLLAKLIVSFALTLV